MKMEFYSALCLCWGSPSTWKVSFSPHQGNIDASMSAQTFSPQGVTPDPPGGTGIPCWVLTEHCPRTSHGTYHIALGLHAVVLSGLWIPSASHSCIHIQFLAQNLDHKKHTRNLYWMEETLSCILFDLRVYLVLLLVKTMQLNSFVDYFNNIYEVMVTEKNMSFSWALLLNKFPSYCYMNLQGAKQWALTG